MNSQPEPMPEAGTEPEVFESEGGSTPPVELVERTDGQAEGATPQSAAAAAGRRANVFTNAGFMLALVSMIILFLGPPALMISMSALILSGFGYMKGKHLGETSRKAFWGVVISSFAMLLSVFTTMAWVMNYSLDFGTKGFLN